MSQPHVRRRASLYKYLPFDQSEKKKFFTLCLLKALLSFFFTMIKVQKSNNLVTGHGAEKVPAAKVLVFILSFLVVIFYMAMSNRYRQDQLIYGIFCTFFTVFALYSFVIMPYADALRPEHAEAWLVTYGGSDFFNHWFKHWVILYINWPKVLFYCIAELWGQFGIIMFFWGLCNEVCTRGEAKRFYHFFIAAGCVGSTLGACFLTHLCRLAESQVGLDDGGSAQEALAKISTWLGVIGMGVVIVVLMLFKWVNANLFTTVMSQKEKEEKTKLSLWEAVKYILSSRYLLAVATMIIACAVSSNLVEITYQRYLNLNGGTPSEYAHFIQWQMFSLNMLCIFAAFFIIPHVMRRLGWKMVAYVAPMIVMSMGGLFFVMSILNKGDALEGLMQAHCGYHAVKVICFVGLAQSVMSTFAKYAFFDGTKEIVYIWMGAEGRRKGKAAIDVVGSRLGKMLSSAIHIVIMGIFHAGDDVRKVTPVLLLIFLAVIVSWFRSVRYLSKTLDEKEEVKVGK